MRLRFFCVPVDRRKLSLVRDAGARKRRYATAERAFAFFRKITRGREKENGAQRRNPVPMDRQELSLVRESGLNGKSRLICIAQEISDSIFHSACATF